MRLAFISDIHEDYITLKRILLKAESRGYDKLICLGDISGFSRTFYKYMAYRDAPACLKLVRERCDYMIPGNHDLHAARKTPVLSDVFDFPGNWYDLEPGKRLQMSEDKLWPHDEDLDPGYNEEAVDFLGSLPEYEIIETPKYQIMLSHYAYPNLSGFKKGFYSWEKEFSEHFALMEKQQCSLCFTGHAHPRGYYVVTKNQFRQYRLRSHRIRAFPAIIGIPPVTRHKHRSGFCIFDTDKLLVHTYR